MILYTHVNKITTIKAHLTEDIPAFELIALFFRMNFSM